MLTFLWYHKNVTGSVDISWGIVTKISPLAVHIGLPMSF